LFDPNHPITSVRVVGFGITSRKDAGQCTPQLLLHATDMRATQLVSGGTALVSLSPALAIGPIADGGRRGDPLADGGTAAATTPSAAGAWGAVAVAEVWPSADVKPG
jgi:hypothetical protein